MDAIEAQGHYPEWFISFDGLSCHDWLRGVKGAEKRALETIGMLCGRGSFVQVHQCVWRDSLPQIRPTVLKLKELGVSRYRITPVEPSLRWMELAPDQSISTEEWQEYIPDFLEWWYEHHIDMDLDIWSYFGHNRRSSRAVIVPDLFSFGRDDTSGACHESEHRPFIDAACLLGCLPQNALARDHQPLSGKCGL